MLIENGRTKKILFYIIISLFISFVSLLSLAKGATICRSVSFFLEGGYSEVWALVRRFFFVGIDCQSARVERGRGLIQ